MDDHRLVELNVGNLRRYIQGEPAEARLSMPATLQEIENILREIGITEPTQEIFLSDIELPDAVDYLKDKINEHTELYTLNLVLQLIRRENPNADAMGLFLREYPDLSMQEIGNLILQADAIPYQNYQFEGVESCGYMSPEEKYGYTINEQTGVYELLKDLGIIDYVDLEAYGRDRSLSGNIALGDEGWYDRSQVGIQFDKYTERELYKLAGLTEMQTKKVELVAGKIK